MLSPSYFEHYTYDDYRSWEGNWELIDSQPYAMTSFPNIRHQQLALEIMSNLKQQTDDCTECEVLSEIDY